MEILHIEPEFRDDKAFRVTVKQAYKNVQPHLRFLLKQKSCKKRTGWHLIPN